MERTAYEIEPVLRAVARTMQACLGFGTVVVNLHRPAWDDFETVVVEGSDEAREVLLGQTSSVADWAPLLDPRFKRRGAYLAYEAMTADRAYRAALSHDEAQAELRGSGTQFDPVVVQAFLQVLAPGGRRLRRQVGAPAV